jgi:hypothetical protein
MSPASRLCLVAYWLGLFAWTSALVTAAVAASFSFATLGPLDLSIAGYTLPPGASAGHLAAGMVMNRIFGFVDAVQLAAAAAVVLSLAVLTGRGALARRDGPSLVRVLCIVAAVCLFAARAVLLTPAMNRDLHAYWEAARAGDVAAAEEHRGAFERRHPRASMLYGATCACLLLAVAASAWAPFSHRGASA